jgi:hypothetical protein
MQKLLRLGSVLSIALCALGINSCHKTKVKPYNLVFSSDGADPNGLMLNPLWGYQFENAGQPPIPLPPPDDPWSSSQTDWDIHSDGGIFCSGHQNWYGIAGDRLRAGTYTGLLTWESHSPPWPFNDDDYSFNLVPMSLTGGPNGAGLQAKEDHLHVEYNVSEVGNRLEPETPWWQQFHHAVDNSGDKPNPFDMLTSRTAIVTGLLGIDTAHPLQEAGKDVSGGTEIHPIWAMAMRVKESSAITLGSADETYAFMARNFGDEGFCADGTQWTLATDTLSILIPWRAGATKIDGIAGEFNIINPPDSNLSNNVSVTYLPPRGVLLTFKLNLPQDDPEDDGTVTEGEIQIHWSGALSNAQPVTTTSGKPPAQAEGPEGAMQRLAEKMTEKQKAAFLTATAVTRLPKQVYKSPLRTAVQVGELPVHGKNPSDIKSIVSKRRAQMEKSRMDALHRIFGETIPGVAEKNAGSAR